MDTEEKKPRKGYSREFKIEAVRMTTTGGVSVAQAARDLGICENTLHKWRQVARRKGLMASQLAEVPRDPEAC